MQPGDEVTIEIDGLETNRVNQRVVDQTLRTARDPNIYAIGDCAAVPQPGAFSA